MATDLSFVQFVLEQARLRERLAYRKMFGEFAIYLDGKVVALACDDSLFVKPVAAVESLTKGLPQRPPYPGAKLYPVADQLLDEPDTLRELLLKTAAALPKPKPKAKKAAKKTRAKATSRSATKRRKN